MADEVKPYTNQTLVTLHDLKPSPHSCGYCKTSGSISNGYI